MCSQTRSTRRGSRRPRRSRGAAATLRAGIGLDADDVAVLSVARLAPEKGLDLLVSAVARAERPRLHLVLAGHGPERAVLEALAGDLGVRITFLGGVAWDEIVEIYAAADIFALLSRHEPWGVVVNEAAACGLPLVLSDRVGAAYDLLQHGRNGFLVRAARAVEDAAAALQRLCDDVELRAAAAGALDRARVGWGYGPSVEGFVGAVEAAVASGHPVAAPGRSAAARPARSDRRGLDRPAVAVPRRYGRSVPDSARVALGELGSREREPVESAIATRPSAVNAAA